MFGETGTLTASDACLVASDRLPCSRFNRFSSRPSRHRPRSPRPTTPRSQAPNHPPQHARPGCPRTSCRLFLPSRFLQPLTICPHLSHLPQLPPSPPPSDSSASCLRTHPRSRSQPAIRRTNTFSPTPSTPTSALRSLHTPLQPSHQLRGRQARPTCSMTTRGSRSGSAPASVVPARIWPAELVRIDGDFRFGRARPSCRRTRSTPIGGWHGLSNSSSSTPRRRGCLRRIRLRPQPRPTRPPSLAGAATRLEKSQTRRC